MLRLCYVDCANLRCCSKKWKTTCDCLLQSTTLPVDQLADGISYSSSLICLKTITITSKNSTHAFIGGNVLDKLQLCLSYLSLTSGLTLESHSNPKITVENLGKLVLPWSTSLRSLYMRDCDLLQPDTDSFTSKGFFSRLPHLKQLRLLYVQATPAFDTLNLSGCTKLEELECAGCNLVSLHINDCRGLRYLDCSHNLLASLEVSGFSDLTELCCQVNRLTLLDMSGCSSLDVLMCYANQLATLHLAISTQLKYLNCSENNFQAGLDISACSALSYMECKQSNLQSINLSACISLQALQLHSNNLSQLDLSACSSLTKLQCQSNQLSSLDLSALATLHLLECSNNYLEIIKLPAKAWLTILSFQGNDECQIISCGAGAKSVYCSSSSLSLLPRGLCAQLHALHVRDSIVTEDLAGFRNLRLLDCHVGPMGSLNLTGCADVHVILYCTTESLIFLGRSTVCKLRLQGIFGLTHLDGFSSLEDLMCDVENLVFLDLSVCKSLKRVDIRNRQGRCMLSNINLVGCSALEQLQCNHFPSLMYLDLSACVGLQSLSCIASGIKSLDIYQCPQLVIVNVSKSQQLERVVTGNICGQVVDIDCQDCPKLRITIGFAAVPDVQQAAPTQ